MAKPVKLPKGKEFHFTPIAKGGQPLKYAWDEWFDGTLLLLERSDVDENGNLVGTKRDYEVDTESMPPKIKSAARKRYKVVEINRLDADGKRLVDSLIIRARDMTPEERTAEDMRRAEERASAKPKKNTDTSPAPAPAPAPESGAA